MAARIATPRSYRNPTALAYLMALLCCVIPLAGAKAAPASKAAIPPNNSIEAIVLSQMQMGNDVTLNCHDTASAAGCGGSIPPSFLVSLLTTESQSADFPRRTLVIHNAELNGPLDLAGMKLLRGLRLENCRIDGGVNLTSVETESDLSFEHCSILGGVQAQSAGVAGSLDFDGTIVAEGVNATEARTGRSLTFKSALISGDLVLREVSVGENLDLSESPMLARNVFLDRANIKGILWSGNSTIGRADLAWRLWGASQPAGEQSGAFGLSEATIDGELVLTGARFVLLQADRMKAAGLALMDVDQVANMCLRGARFGQDLVLGAAVITGGAPTDCAHQGDGIEAEDIQIKGRLTSGKLQTPGLNIAGSTIDGDVDLSRAGTVGGDLNAANTRVGGNFWFGHTVAGTINLNGAHIAGSLYMTNDQNPGAHFDGGIRAYNVSIGGSVYFTGGEFDHPAIFAFGNFGRNVYFSGAPFKDDVNFGGAHIGGLLVGWPTIADQKHKLSLRGASTDWVSDAPSSKAEASADCRPEVPKLDLQGFTYGHFGGPTEVGGGTLSRNVNWYLCLLERDDSFSFQPYRQAASVFRSVGEDSEANIILRRANFRELSESLSDDRFFDFLQTVFLGLLIGWGLGWGYVLAFVWILVFTSIGAHLLYKAKVAPANAASSGARHRASWCVLASLTHFIPLVTLDEECQDSLNKSLPLQNWRMRAFFAFHAALGYLVGACLAAAVAGLTQAS